MCSLPGSIADVSHVCCADVFRLPLTLAPYIFVAVTTFRFQFVRPLFRSFFKTFRTFALRVSIGLVLA